MWKLYVIDIMYNCGIVMNFLKINLSEQVYVTSTLSGGHAEKDEWVPFYFIISKTISRTYECQKNSKSSKGSGAVFIDHPPSPPPNFLYVDSAKTYSEPIRPRTFIVLKKNNTFEGGYFYHRLKPLLFIVKYLTRGDKT